MQQRIVVADVSHSRKSDFANWPLLTSDQRPIQGARDDVVIIRDQDVEPLRFCLHHRQPIDFFGDGPRIPFTVVSPLSRGGRVVHTYYDHVSILKFIERNWHLKPLTARSRDNLPNPIAHEHDPYVPRNSPRSEICSRCSISIAITITVATIAIERRGAVIRTVISRRNHIVIRIGDSSAVPSSTPRLSAS